MRTRERVRQLGEVFTPPHIVSDMLDLLPDSVFAPDGGEQGEPATFLEPACGNGNFLAAIYRRKVVAGTDPLAALAALYGIDIDPGNVAETRERMVALAVAEGVNEGDAVDVVRRQIICGDALKLDLTTCWERQ